MPVFWIALAFGIHIAMVNIGIFLSVYVPVLKRRADRLHDRDLDRLAYRLMRFYAATYAAAGVFGTAYTVFLFSFYPGFMGLAGHITLAPFGLAVAMIAVHFLSITAYYYGWDRWNRRVHSIFGYMLAASAILIPLGFRSVFAFLNTPIGISVSGGRIVLDFLEALTSNPTLLPLYLKSVVASITAGAIVFAWITSWMLRGRTQKLWVMRDLAITSLIGLAVMPVLGVWYALSLRVVPYKYNSIFSGIGLGVEGGTGPELSGVFLLKMVLYAIQVAVMLVAGRRMLRGVIPANIKPLALAGASAIATIVIGEYLNAFSQYPCFIAAYATSEGCRIPPWLPGSLGSVLDLRAYNQLASIPAVNAMTAILMAALIAVMSYLIFYMVTKE